MAVFNNANTTKKRKKVLEKDDKTKVRAPAKPEKSTTKQPQKEQTQTRSDLPTVVPWDAKTGDTRKIYDEMHGGAEKYMGTVVRNALGSVLKPGSAYNQAERQMQNAQARQQFYADLANAGVKHGDDKTFFTAAGEFERYQNKYNRTYDNYVRALQTEQERYGRRAKDAAREYEQSSQTNAAYYKDKINYAVTQGDYKAAMDWMDKMTNAPLTPEERQKASDFIDLRYRYDPLVREQQEAEQILRNPNSTNEQMFAAQQRLNAATERANSDAAYYQFRKSADYYKTRNAMTAFRQKGADEVKRASGNAGHGAQMDSYLRSQNAMLLLQQLYDALQTEGNTNRERMFDALEATKEELRRYGVELGDLDESNFRTKLEQAMTEQGGKVKAMRAVLGQEGYDTDAIYENLNYERQLKDYQANQQAFMEWGKNAGFGDKLAATIASVPYSVYAKPIEGINSFLGMVGSGSVSDPNNYRPVAPQNSMADMIRGGITENTNGVDRFLYSGVTSALDSALNAFSFGGHLGLATMGLSAANTRANEILEKGGNAQQAFSGGLTSGVIEALTEIVSIENLIDFAQNTGSLRQLAKNVGLQMFTEGSEEIAGEVLDIIADASIMGNLSDNAQAVQTYVAQGMTLAEAKREVLKDNALQILESGASGAFSGGLSGGLASGAGYLANRMQQRADERRLQNTFYEAIGESVRDEDGLAEDLGAYAAEKGLKFRAGQVQEAPQAAETPENQSLRQRENQIRQQQRTEQKNQKANTKLGKSAGEALTRLGEEFRGRTVAASEARYTELTNKYKSDAFREQAQEAVKSSAAERYSGAKDLQTLEELHKDNVKGVKNKELLQAAEAAYRDKVYDLSTSRDEAARARQGARYANRSGEDINLTASYKADGQEVTSQVKRISEQKGQVVLENGTEANIQDLEMDADAKDLLTRLSQSVQGEAANTVLAMVRGAMRSGTVVDGYRTMANAISVYDQGRVGNVTREQALSRTSLDGDLAGRLYDLGSKTGQEAVRDAQAEIDRQRTEAKKKGATGRRGSVDLSQIDTKSLDARQRLQVALATKIAEAVGVDVEFFASEAKGGRYQGEQGAYEVGKGKIRLDINAGRNYVSSVESGILRTMSHELTHFIQDYSPEMYDQLKTFSMKTLTDKFGDEGLEDLIQSKIDRESGLSRLDAEDEVIADACEMMLKDSSVIRELYEQNPDLAYKIREWLTRFLKKVSEAFGGPMSTEARALRDSFAEMQKLWDQGLKDAAAAHQDIGELTDANYDRHATRSLLTATGFRVELEGQQVVAYDQDGNRVTEVTTDHVKNSGYGNLIKYAYQSGTISRKDMNKQIEGLAELMNTILKAQDGPMVWAYSGAMMFSAIKSNSDGQYTTTVDFTTVCRKTVEMVKAMSHTMKKLGRGLTIDEITQLQDKVLHTTVMVNGKEEGGIVNCPVCYVFSRWAGIGKILDNMKTFQEKYKDSKYDDVETLNKAIADLKKAAKIEKLSDLRKILPELDDEYEKLGNENLQLKEDLDKARKERNRIKARKSSTAEEKAAAVQKVNEINNQIKQNKERMGVIESSLAPELSWLTTVRAYQDPNNKDRYLPNLDFMKNGYVPEDVLFDLDKGDVFAGTYTEAWKYRTGRGPSAGKAIVPYSDMRLGDLILGPGNNSAEGNNTFYEVSNEFTEKQQEAIIKAVQRMKAQNLIGGQRFQSTSDFRYEYGLDYLQSFLELQAIGGKMQTYTKIVEYAEMVASMGGDVNLSVMGLGSGLDENGILIYSSVTGIDPEAAKLITHKFDSAQTILVGINDAHIRAALDDTEIGDGGHGGLEVGFVIPYHASGASITKFIAKLVANLGEKWDRSNYRDYSDVQTDSVKTYPGMEGSKKADVEAATAALVNAMIVNPTNPTFKRSLTAEQKDWVRRALLREVRNSILTRTAPAAFVKNNGETDEDAARRFIESCRSLFEGTSEDIKNRSFDELRSIERRAMQGDKDAIAEYESWSAGVMFDLYNKMWMDSSRDDTYGVKLSSEQAKTIMPHEYWDRDTIRYRFDKDGKVIKDSGNAYVNGFIFRSYCYALGLNPRFTGITTKNEVLRTAKNKKTGELGTPYGDFSDERGYWKTLIDRAMYDNQGRYRDQNAINVTKLSDGSMLKPEYGRAKYGDLMVQEPREDRAIKAANAFVEDVRKKEGKVQHSQRDESLLSDYEVALAADPMTAATNEEQRKMLTETQDRIRKAQELQRRLVKTRAEADSLEGGAKTEKLNIAKDLQNQINRITGIIDKNLNSAHLHNLLKEQRKAQRERTMGQYRERRSKQALKSRIKNLHAEMQRDLLKPREGHFVPQSLIRPVVDLLDMVNTQTNRAKSESAQARIDAINRAYDQIRKDERYSQYYDETVKDMLVELSSTLEGRSIYDLNSEELSDVYTAMKAMRTTIRNAIKADLIEKGKQIWEIGNSLRQELRAGKGASPYLLEKYHMSMLSAERAFHRFGGYRQNSAWDKVYRMLDDAQLKMLNLEMQATRIFDPVLKAKADFRQAEALTSTKEKDLVDVGLKDADGNAVKITRGMMLSLYMHLQNEENMRHLMYGGMTLPDFKRYYNGNSEAWGRGTVEIPALGAKVSNLDELLETEGEVYVDEKYKEYQDEIREMYESVRSAIEDELTDYDRKWIAASKEFFDGFSRQALNAVTNAMYGFSKAKVNNYFPIVTDSNFLKSEFDSISRNISLENAGFMKERVRAGNPILLEDITKAVNRQISNVSRYAGLTQALKTFGNVYNVQTKGFTDSVKKAMAKSYGKNGQEYVQNLITDMIGGRSQPGTIFDRIKGNYAQAVLSANLSVMIKQAASFPTAAATVGWGPIMKALSKGGRKGRVISRADRTLIDTYSPLLWYRAKGAIDTEIGDMAHAQDWTKKAKYLMDGIQRIDLATVGRLWYAAEYYVKSNFDLEKGTEAQIKNGDSPFYQKVAEVFNRIVEDTQPNYTVLQRPDILRNPSKLVRAMTMFSTQRFQNANILIDAVNEYAAMVRYDKKGSTAQTKAARKASKTKLTRAISSQVVSAVTLNAMTLLAGALMHRMNPWRDDDDELTAASIAEEYLNGFVSSMAGSFLGGAELYEAISAILTGSKYYGNDVGGISTLSEFATAFVEFGQKAVKLIGDEDSKPDDWKKLAEKQLWKIGEYLSQMTGVPAANIRKIIEGGKNHITDIINGEFGSFEAGLSRANATNGRRYYKAWLAGDDEKMAEVLEEMRANTDGTKKEVNQKVRADIAARAKEAYKSGEIDLDGYLDFLADTGLWEPDALKGKTTETIKDLYNDGEISEDEAIHLLVDKNGFDEDDAWFKVQEWEDKAQAVQDALDAGLDADEAEPVSGSDYRRIYDAIDANQDIDQLVDELVEHGRQRDAILESVKDHIVEDYEDGKYTDRQLKELLARHCRITKTDEVNKIVNSAKCYRETGHRLSNVRESVINGSLTKDEAQKILTKYGGDDLATAKNKARAYDFARQHPDLDWNVDTVTRYYDAKPDTGRVKKTPYGAGISVETYNTFLANAKGLTKKQEYIDAIAATPGLTDEQKELLLRLKYDLPKESDENKKYDIPWH